jgi:hypothetical protein
MVALAAGAPEVIADFAKYVIGKGWTPEQQGHLRNARNGAENLGLARNIGRRTLCYR